MEEALIKRTMPNSLEAEQSVIGSMIVDKDAILTADIPTRMIFTISSTVCSLKPSWNCIMTGSRWTW